MDATGYAGTAQAIGGAIQTFAAMSKQFEAIKAMTEAAEKEMQAISIQGEELARTAIERAYAALRDSRFLSEVTDANIRYLREQETDAIGTTVAQAAGSGLDFIGSPVLVAAEVSLNVNKAIQNQKLTEKYGVQQFEFEVQKELRNAGLAREGARIAIEATAVSRSAQIGAATFDAFKSLSVGASQVSSILSSDVSSILSRRTVPQTGSNTEDLKGYYP